LVVAIIAGLALSVFAGTARADDPLARDPVIQANLYAQSTWPDEFAGFWLDFDYNHTEADFDRGGIPPDQKVFIAFTSGAEEKVAKIRELFPTTNPYVAVTHTYSEATLMKLQGRVTKDLREYVDGQLAIPGPAFTWHGTGIWVVDNVVEVNLSEVTPEYEAWAAERYGELFPALRIFAGPEIVPLMDTGQKQISRKAPKRGKKCGPACKRAKVRKRILRRKCARAVRRASKHGSPGARKLARSKKCRALRQSA
jgi:hypothetical protein